jgi:predicted acylesterase/phospholipase RssA
MKAYFIPFFLYLFEMENMGMKKACVISGGGSWGAYGGGTLARINGEYDTIVGVSTGSLLAPLAALREWELLKSAYTTVKGSDIFDSCWYKGKPLSKDGKLKKLPIVMSLILGQKSVCTSDALRKTIDRFFSNEHFEELREKRKEILVGTQNFAQVPSKIHYFSSIDENYEEFKDWMWCSANFPFFTSLVKKSWRDGQGNFHVGLWSDGGLTDLVGLDQLSMKGFKEIDIILHRRKNINSFEGNKVHTLMENVTTSINAMRYDIEFDYFYEKIKRFNKQGTKVTIYWLPRKLSQNSMVFNKKEMSAWWEEGYNTAFDSDRIEVFESTKKRF